MNRHESVRLLGAVAVVVLLLGSVVSNWAAVPARADGFKTFKKLAWGLTLRYPDDWTVKQGDDAVVISFNEGDDNMGAFLMARDASFADAEADPAELFARAASIAGGDVEQLADLSLVPDEERTLAGIPAQGYALSATDVPTGQPVTGLVYQLARGDQGYLLTAAAQGYGWDVNQSLFEIMLDSLTFGRQATPATPAEPTPEPTRTLRGARATATPTVEATPRRVGRALLSAREAFDLARPVAEEWSAEAALSKVFCSRAAVTAGREGKCEAWEMTFLSNTSLLAEARTLTVRDTGVSVTGTEDAVLELELGPSWLDSSEIWPLWLLHVGDDFFGRHPRAPIQLTLQQDFSERPLAWEVKASLDSDPDRASFWTVRVDAETGEVDTSPEQAEPASDTYVTAGEAFQIAEPNALQWSDGAELAEMHGSVTADEPGSDDGSASWWTLYFSAPELVDARNISITGDEVTYDADDDFSVLPPAVSGDWPDTPEVLSAARGQEEYAVFGDLYSRHGWDFRLSGDEAAGYTWDATAAVGGVGLTLRLGPEEFGQ